MNYLTSEKLHRFIFTILVLISTLFLIIPEYLPLIDLPQHAAQVSTLDDLLKHRSPWNDILFIQWDTPYLTMYLFWLAIYQFTDIILSAKIVVVLEFLFYIYAIRKVRKAFGATRLFDYIALTCFFGYAFQWGFLGFISAIPVGFLFLVANKQWIETHQNKYLIHITLLGIWCYYSHVLPYAFFCFISYGYFLFSIKNHTKKQIILFTLPYLLFAGILLRYLSIPDPAPLMGYFPTETIQDSFSEKTFSLIYTPWNMFYNSYYDIAAIIIYLAPFLLGYRPKKEMGVYILFFATLLIWYLLPRTTFKTLFVYIRFSLFIPIFYYLLWEKRPLDKAWKINCAQVSYLLISISIIGFIFKLCNNHIAFNQSEDMHNAKMVLQHMQPNKRSLGLFEPLSATADNLTYTQEYLHFIHQWYQAQKHGWSDYSFAATHAMPVRLKSSALYQHYGLNRTISKSNMSTILNCQPYDYLILKIQNFSTEEIESWLKQNPQCQNMQVSLKAGHWLLFERKSI